MNHLRARFRAELKINQRYV